MYAHLLLLLSIVTLVCSGVLEEEEWRDRGRSAWTSCSWGSVCTPISSCGIISQLIETSCLNSLRANKIVCGYDSRGEAMVCCPENCPSSNKELCGAGPRLLGPQLVFPWSVRVSFLNKDTGVKAQLCIGSIISRRVVLTAAHCALAKTKSHKIQSVLVGGESCCDHKETALSHVVIHPAYKPTAFNHNIALLVLKYPLNFTRSVQPVCLAEQSESFIFVNQRALLVGWGRLGSKYEESGSQEMMELPLLPRSSCRNLYGNTVNITEDMICAGGEGTDPCSGFGGAPLVVTDPRRLDKYYQVGIVSFGGDKCGTHGIPTVFTRVESYLKWIEANSPQDS